MTSSAPNWSLKIVCFGFKLSARMLNSCCTVIQASDSSLYLVVSVTADVVYVSPGVSRFLHTFVLMSAHCYAKEVVYLSCLSFCGELVSQL
jgi:hypothetical protein